MNAIQLNTELLCKMRYDCGNMVYKSKLNYYKNYITDLGVRREVYKHHVVAWINLCSFDNNKTSLDNIPHNIRRVA